MKNAPVATAQKIRKTKMSLKTYVLFSLIIAIFALIVVKDVSLPRTVTLPIAFVGMAILLYAGIAKPQFALLLFVGYLPFSKILIGQFGAQVVGLNLSNIIMFIVILGWVGNALSRGEKIFNKSTLNPIILAFCLWGFISVLRAKYIYGSAYDLESFFILFKRWVTPILIYFILYCSISLPSKSP